MAKKTDTDIFETLDSPDSYRDFPLRYETVPKDGGGRGAEEGEHTFSYNYTPLYLNTYALAPCSMNMLSGAGEMMRRMFGNQLFAAICPDSVCDLMRMLTYEIGLIFPKDIVYFLGIGERYINKHTDRAINYFKHYIRYEGKMNYTKWLYYVFRPNKEPFCSYPVPSPVNYAGKTLSARSLPHTYSIGLSQLAMRLYCVRRPQYFMEVSLEVPIGNFGYTSPTSKQGSEVAADAICTVWKDGEERPNVLLLEQDMGTEPYAVLLRKLRDYGATSFFNAEVAANCSIVLSCHEILAADRKLLRPDHARFVALYLYLCAYASYGHGVNALANEDVDILLLMGDLGKNKDLHLFDKASDELYQGFCRAYCNFGILEDGSYLGISSLERIFSEFDYIRCHGWEEWNYLLLVMGYLTPDEHILCHCLTLGEIHRFLATYNGKTDDDLLVRLVYNQELCRTTRNRHLGFANAMLDVVYGRRGIEKRTVSTAKDAVNECTYLAPLFTGYSLFTCSSMLLTNYMPYILWDEESEPIQALLDALLLYYPDISDTYKPFSDFLDLTSGTTSHDFKKMNGLPYPFRLKHCYYSSAVTTQRESDVGNGDGLMAAGVRVCVEDISFDTAAYVRAFLFASYYAGTNPIKLVLLVDTVFDAMDFYTKHMSSSATVPLSRSDRCVVELYEDGNKGYLNSATSGILFLEKPLLRDSDCPNRLFGFNSSGQIVYMTP